MALVALYASVQEKWFINHQDNFIKELHFSELQRFSAISHALKKQQFLLSRYLMRIALGQLGVQDIKVYRIENYQRLIVNNGENIFSISITHSADFAAVAITDKQCKIGIDFEKCKPRNFQELSNVILTTTEQQLFAQQKDQCLAFYRLWTTKEALTKASQTALEQLYKCNCAAVMITTQGIIEFSATHYHYAIVSIEQHVATIVINTHAEQLNNIWQHYVQ